MTPKQNNTLYSESFHPTQDRKKHFKVGVMSSQCWVLFVDYEGVVQHKYSPWGQLNNKEYYVEILKE